MSEKNEIHPRVLRDLRAEHAKALARSEHCAAKALTAAQNGLKSMRLELRDYKESLDRCKAATLRLTSERDEARAEVARLAETVARAEAEAEALRRRLSLWRWLAALGLVAALVFAALAVAP